MRQSLAVWILNLGFFAVAVVWINSIISICDSMGLTSTNAHMAVGGASLSLVALYFSTAALRDKGIDPMFWRP